MRIVIETLFFYCIKSSGIRILYWVSTNLDSSWVGPLERQNFPNKYLTQLHSQSSNRQNSPNKYLCACWLIETLLILLLWLLCVHCVSTSLNFLG